MIELPQRFKNDTQGKDTYLVPLVIINNTLHLSTAKVTLRDINEDKKHYDPLLKSLGSVKESIDIFEKKFKLSSVKMDFFSYEYNNEKLIDRLFKTEAINAPVDVYYKSQSAVSINDCIKVYTGYIKDILEKNDIISLDIEDRTEQVLGKKVPYSFTKATDLPEEQRNRPIPIVYGEVDRCPLVYLDNDNPDNSKTYKLAADNFDIGEVSDLKVFTGDSYLSAPKTGNLKNYEGVANGSPQIQNALLEEQWNIQNNAFIISTSFNTAPATVNPESGGDSEEVNSDLSAFATGPLTAFNCIEVLKSYKPRFTSGKYTCYNWKKPEVNIVQKFEHNLTASHNKEGTISSDGSLPFYVKVLDFDEDEVPHQMTLDTRITNVSDTYFADYSNEYIRGYNTYNFEVDEFCSGSDVLKEYNDVTIRGICWIDYSIDIKYGATFKGEDGWRTPVFFFNFGAGRDINECRSLFSPTTQNLGGYFDFDENESLGGNLYAEAEAQFSASNNGNTIYAFHHGNFWFNDPAETDNPENPAFSISTERAFGDAFLTDAWGAGYIDYMGFTDLTLHKNAILQNFNDFDLYSKVLGRVDNQSLRYTSTQELQTLSGTQGGFQQPKEQYQPTTVVQPRPTRPSRTSRISIDKRQTPARGGKGGGY